MMQLFKTIQTRKKIVVLAPKLKNQETKEEKITEKKVGRFLTRGIILKLKKNQSINSALAFANVAFTFYQNKSNHKDKKSLTEKQTNCLIFAPKVKDQKDKFNKNLNCLQEPKLIGGYVVNTKPIKILQKKTVLSPVPHSAFLKIKPFFNVLQKLTGLLLKKNVCLIKEAYPFIYAGLKGASTISGFKKVLYNKILVQDRRLKPTYNRRKHNTSHYMVVQNQLTRLSKTFVYLGKNKLASMVALVLKTAYSTIFPAFSWAKAKKHNYFNNKLLMRVKAIPNLVSVMESQITLLLWRNQFSSSFTKNRQNYKQDISQNLNVICKNPGVIKKTNLP